MQVGWDRNAISFGCQLFKFYQIANFHSYNLESYCIITINYNDPQQQSMDRNMYMGFNLNLKELPQINPFGLQINDMKKYSSYKTIKPLNTSINYVTKQPQSPTHSTSYRKLTSIDISNQRPLQKPQVYPMSAKYSNYVNLSTTNGGRKKMFSSKNIQTPNRPLTLQKPNYQEPSPSMGYGNIRSKINDLQSRLNEIKKNYDLSYNNRKYSQKDSKQSENYKKEKYNEGNRSVKVMKQNDKSNNIRAIQNSKNKENELPKEKKTQSKMLLQRYQNNKRLKNISSVSTVNLQSNIQPNVQMNRNLELMKKESFGLKPPLSPKNIININNLPASSKKTEPLIFNSKSVLRETVVDGNSYVTREQTRVEEQRKKGVQGQINNQQQSSYLKEYVTTFTCDNKLPLTHSTSQTNLYKPHNKLSLSNTPLKNKYYVSAILSAFDSVNLTSFQNLCKHHMSTSLDILTYIKNAKKVPPQQFNCRPLPPVQSNKHSIIFDLDETLIHCNQNLSIEHDVALPIKFPNGAVLKAGINIRPYAKQCLRQLSKHFQIIVFTASHQCYGNVIVDYLDPKNQFVSHRYFRDSCFKTEQGFYVKDLRVVDRDLRKVLLIDNAAYSYCFQLQNGVPIIPFYDNKADLELKNLVGYIKGFLNVGDVRTKNEQQMKLSQYVKFKDTKTLISKLYGGSQ